MHVKTSKNRTNLHPYNYFRFVRKIKEEKNTEWRDSIANFVLQCVETRQRPAVIIPVAGQEHRIRSKAPKPDKSEAIASHQTRGLSK